MTSPSETPPSGELFTEKYELLQDPAFRRRVRQLDPKALAEVGFAPYEGVEIKVVTSSPGVLHMPMPALPPGVENLSAEELQRIQGGGVGSVGTAGCGSSASTIGTVTTSLSSVMCASTIGTAGTAF